MTVCSIIPEEPARALRLVMEHLSDVSFESLPPIAVARAKDVVADIIGCMIGGRSTAASARICNLADRWSGIDGDGASAQKGRSAPCMAFAAAFMARAFDFGVGGSSILSQTKPPVHISEALVPVALTMAQKKGLSGREFITALVTGEDFTGRLAASLDYIQPTDCRGTVNTLGCAVTAAKALGLSAEGFEHALFIALHQVGGIKQGIQFNLGQGFSAMFGVMAAELAEQGILGVSDPIKEARTILGVFSSGFDSETFFHRLGQDFHTSVSFKPYACCRATHSSIDCTLDLLAQGLRQEDITNVVVHVSPWTCAHLVGRPFMLRENPQSDAIFSLQYAVASVLLRGDYRLEYYTEPYIKAPEVTELVKKIRITSDGWPLHAGDPKLSAFITVETKDGRSYTANCRFPRGHEQIGTPLDAEEKKAKFMANCALGGLSESTAQFIYDEIQRLEELDDLSAIVSILGCQTYNHA